MLVKEIKLARTSIKDFSTYVCKYYRALSIWYISNYRGLGLSGSQNVWQVYKTSFLQKGVCSGFSKSRCHIFLTSVWPIWRMRVGFLGTPELGRHSGVLR